MLDPIHWHSRNEKSPSIVVLQDHLILYETRPWLRHILLSSPLPGSRPGCVRGGTGRCFTGVLSPGHACEVQREFVSRQASNELPGVSG